MQASEPLATLPATYGDDEAAPDSALHSLHLQSSSLNGDMASSSSSNLSVTGAGSASFAKHPSNNTLPFNEQIIFELSKQVVLSSQFDMVLQSVEDFQAAEHKMWAGAVWANLASVRPLTTKDIYSAPPPLGDAPVFEGGLEHLLRIVFTKFASKEFAEGVFLLRAEFGADWFSPILQHPFCILRHTNVPAPIEIPIAIAMEPLLSDPLGGKQPAVGTSAPSTTASSNKRQKRGSGAAVDISAPAAAAAGAMASTSSGGAGNGGTRVPSPPAQATACVQPPFESYVMFYLGPNVKEFCSVFRSVALVPGINSWCAVVGPPPPTMGSGSGMSGAMSAGGGGSGNLGNDM
ncbi:hypothetical protein BC830DRAFT_545644 [Chytriomyces sp. MP71]|nr:hypothetical protein BC830DRAFT_545644 [Chytriomyces sp. MP71]